MVVASDDVRIGTLARTFHVQKPSIHEQIEARGPGLLPSPPHAGAQLRARIVLSNPSRLARRRVEFSSQRAIVLVAVAWAALHMGVTHSVETSIPVQWWALSPRALGPGLEVMVSQKTSASSAQHPRHVDARAVLYNPRGLASALSIRAP